MEAGAARLTRSIVVGAPRNGLFGLCERTESLSDLLRDVLSVERTGRRTHRWRARRDGALVSWETEATSLTPPERIEWRSREPATGAQLDGEVSFEELPDGRTEVRLVLNCEQVPGGSLREAERLVDENLESFKAGAETRGPDEPAGEQRNLDGERAASMADEGGAAAARVAGGTPDPERDEDT